MPTKQPHGQERTLEQQWANQALHHRRLRIAHVHRSVKRCRVVKDRIRLWKDGVRDLVMELCGALHTFRVRLTPWQPMVEAGYTQGSWRSYRCSSFYTLARDTTAPRPFASHGPGAAQR